MNRFAAECPQAYDLEPMCFEVDPHKAISHARGVCKQLGLPDEAIHVAMGVVVPNAEDTSKILYGFRRSDFHSEYKNTWGLPSIGLPTDEFLRSSEDAQTFHRVLARVGERKLQGTPLIFDRPIAWTGRIRLHKNDPQFLSDYYLVMVDVKARPLSPRVLPHSTSAYSELQWLTPDEHTALVMKTPSHACGACSDLASLASRMGKL